MKGVITGNVSARHSQSLFVAGANVKTGKLCDFVWPFQHIFLGGVILLLTLKIGESFQPTVGVWHSFRLTWRSG